MSLAAGWSEACRKRVKREVHGTDNRGIVGQQGVRRQIDQAATFEPGRELQAAGTVIHGAAGAVLEENRE